MKGKFLALAIGAVALVAIGATSAMAAKGGNGPKAGDPVEEWSNGAPSGFHYSVNLIGVTRSDQLPDGGEGSGGSAIFIPLQTTTAPDSVICTDTSNNQTWFIEDTEAEWVNTKPAGGAKIYFTPTTTEKFAILDRDATDSDGAEIRVPVSDDGDRYIELDLYVRVLGKPGGCAEIQGWAEDVQQNAWFWSGTIALDRKTGKSTFIKATDIFDVHYCDITDCIATTQELSVFNSLFEDYFWEILNDGTRLVQMRFFPRD